MPETIVREEEQKDTILVSAGLSDGLISFEIQGQTGERSYEDRDVYINIETEGSTGALQTGINGTTWLRAEDALELGNALIKHGRFAFKANMINHQLIHHVNQLNEYIKEHRVAKIIFRMTDDSPANHGPGFKVFKIEPQWANGMEPQYNEDFSFEKVIYWSTLADEYRNQLEHHTKGLPYEFIDYDHDKAIDEFNVILEQIPF